MISENDFLNIILPAIRKRQAKAIENTPATKDAERESEAMISITFADLLKYMEQNEIPPSARIVHETNGFLLYWTETETTREEDYIKRMKEEVNSQNTFSDIAKELEKKGYTRTPVWSKSFEPYANTSVYDMYIRGQYEQLKNYYSLFFDNK